MKFTKEDYIGEFNLKKAEKDLIMKALGVMPTKKAAAVALGITEKTLFNKLYDHSI